MGHYQIHVFVSLIVILGAAGVVMIADLLQRRGEVAEPLAAGPTPVPQDAPLPAPVAAGGRRDWNSVLKSGLEASARPKIALVRPQHPVVVTRGAPAQADLPEGFHDEAVLADLVASRRTVSGLVVSVRVILPETLDLAPVLASLMEPRDFAARVSSGEYLLIFPNRLGLSAQARFAQLGTKLAELERAGGKVRLAYGGVEVLDENLSDAIVYARERRLAEARGRMD